MPPRTISASRYVTPLREGGSLPAVVEGDDDGMYVLKFRGAGQGPNALIAELVAGELGRAAGLPVPEIVFVQVDAELARTEPDAEIQQLIRASAGLNFGIDWLPGAVTYDPVVEHPASELASAVVWFDAFIMNVDRTPRNLNMLLWHRQPWLIDHGAALYFHHRWTGATELARSPFPLIRDHALLPFADALVATDARLAPRLTPEVIAGVVAQIPDAWLEGAPEFVDHAEHRDAYRRFLIARLAAPRTFVEEAVRARSVHL